MTKGIRLIPLHDAHALLDAFGIGLDNQGSERLSSDGGFTRADLEDVLVASSLVLTVDWRECLSDALEAVQAALGSLGSHCLWTSTTKAFEVTSKWMVVDRQ